MYYPEGSQWWIDCKAQCSVTGIDTWTGTYFRPHFSDFGSFITFYFIFSMLCFIEMRNVLEVPAFTLFNQRKSNKRKNNVLRQVDIWDELVSGYLKCNALSIFCIIEFVWFQLNNIMYILNIDFYFLWGRGLNERKSLNLDQCKQNIHFNSLWFGIHFAIIDFAEQMDGIR